ncbi:M14 family zinc carboxypeptidase [Steroidobacter sp.]|uniref:M14 family metallopeptidase n=1 Tax=Steroidobacter sp. TaxID=1978227 RepID=UPI001A550E5C|nr:M14 family zinc carboxypeptidase [Steroidobacter sp.]MBL8266529.1 hypothetical protein [Steroidobacter sp.]
MSSSRPLRLIAGIAGTLLLAAAGPSAAQAGLQTPEQFFGFQMGADRKLAGWDKLHAYYEALDKASDRMQMVELGKSSEGRPYVAIFISSAENLAKLDRLRQLNAQLADPRGVSEAQARQIAGEARAVIIQSFALHSSEVAAAQTAAEFVYDSIAREDTEAKRIRDNVINIVMPSINPDGTQMIADWYMKYVGTKFEASGLPWLYQRYAGHDNNRDGFALNLPESQHFGKLMYRDWVPQAYVDHHQQGANGARLVIPPYAEPIRPNGDPLVWREMSWFGSHMGTKLEGAGKTGVIGSAVYSGWGHMGFHWITPFHNIAGMLTESASARLATPIYMHPDQLRGEQRNMPTYEPQVSMPSVWPGGWWRVRDIVEQQKIAAWSTVDLAARDRETLLWNMYLKGVRQVERGTTGEVKAYVIEAAQHDPLTVEKLVNMFLRSGVEVRQAKAAFVADGRTYGAGSFVVSMAQPKQSLVRWMLGRTFYPDNTFTRDQQNNPIRPYDLSTDTFNEFMGVRAEPVGEAVSVELATLAAPLVRQGRVDADAGNGYVLSTKLNDSFRAAFLLLNQGAKVRRVTDASGFTPGDFLVSGVSSSQLQEVARRTGVDFKALQQAAPANSYALRKPRIAMFQRYGGGNSDEGWTRLMFEQFDVPYTTLMDARIKKGNLNAAFDTIILPSDSAQAMLGEQGDDKSEEDEEYADEPPEYRSGFGKDGVKALKAFVKKGGTLVTFGRAGELAVNELKVPVRNVIAKLPSKEFWSPGSTLKTRFDTTNPIAYGMPAQGLALLMGGEVYELSTYDKGEDVKIIATYLDRDILQSGWLLGEKNIANKAAAVSVKYGEGRVVLLGFRPQHRDQTHGTFKLVFNSLLNQ